MASSKTAVAAMYDEPAEAVWAASVGFRRFTGYMVVLTLSTYALLNLLFRATIADREAEFRPVGMVHNITCACFVVVLCSNVRTLADRRVETPLSNTDASAAMRLVISINTMAVVSHMCMALGSMPVGMSFAGRRVMTAQYSEWLCSIPNLMVLMHSLVGSTCVPPDEAKVSLGKLSRWVWADPGAEVWRAVLAITVSTLLGSVPTLYDLGFAWNLAFLLASSVLFLHIFLTQWRLSGRAEELLDSRDEDSTDCAAAQLEERAAACAMLCTYCAGSWTFLCLVYFAAQANVISHDCEAYCLSIFDICSKALYSTAAGDIHFKFLSPTRMATLLVAMERAATAKRRMFLRYVMHEVRVPLNTVHLGVEAILARESSHHHQRAASSPASLATMRPAMMMTTKNHGGLICDHLPRDGHLIPATTAMGGAHASSLDEAERRRGAAEDDDSTVAVLQTVRASIRAMSGTLDDTLSLAAIEEGRFELQYEPFDLVATLLGAFRLFDSVAQQQGVHLVAHVAPDLPACAVGDARRLASVVSNFTSNAIKFTRPVRDQRRLPRIALELRVQDQPPLGLLAASSPFASDDVFVRVEVTDEGCGIAPHEQRRLFEPFSQIRPAELQEGGGSGLGLAISKNVIKLHGGDIGLRSDVGVGSTFFFVVPLKLGDAAAEALVRERKHAAALPLSLPPPLSPTTTTITIPPPQLRRRATRRITTRQKAGGATKKDPPTRKTNASAPAATSRHQATLRDDNDDDNDNKAPPQPAPRPPRRARALVVDDVLVNRRLLAISLKNQHFDCTSVGDGRQAVEVIREDRLKNPPEDQFKVVLMDAVMPVMGGLEATRIIRAEGYTGLLLGCTGNALDLDIIDFVNAGANTVLTKPICLRRLKDLLTDL